MLRFGRCDPSIAPLRGSAYEWRAPRYRNRGGPSTLPIMSERRDLFPPIEPYRSGRLRLDARHVMYWEESGNPHGASLLFLHGGPGAGATAVHRRFFDPAYWRIVIFDQRGGGRSTPLGEVRDNSPDHLIGDIEQLRQELGIAEWLIFGGSWGSTLALHYAETYPW